MPHEPPRIMPERWFHGHTYGAHVSSLSAIHADWRSPRPLADGERRLGRFILPPFQRGLVWTDRQKVRLIESIYAGLPIGSIVWNQTDFENECDGWLLDGQQRTSTILDWMDGVFPVNGWNFPDLPDVEKRHFHRMTVSLIETNISDVGHCRDIYDRLAYGGTPHE